MTHEVFRVSNSPYRELDAAYRERNAVVAALIRLFPSGGFLPSEDGDGEWRIYYVDLPAGQVSWHVGRADWDLFEDIGPYRGEWDGHDTDEKYRRVAALRRGDICRDVNEAVRRAMRLPAERADA
jgi:hypothetical protein